MELLQGGIFVPAVPLQDDLNCKENLPRGDEQIWCLISTGRLQVAEKHRDLHVQEVHFCGAKAMENIRDEQNLHCLPNED